MKQIERERALKRLIEEQTNDLKYDIVYPEVIKPALPVILDGLKPREKAVLVLSVLHGMSNVEIGEAFCIREGYAADKGWR